MSRLIRLGTIVLAVLLVASFASGGLVSCSSSSDTAPASDPSTAAGGGSDEESREICTVECAGLGQTEGTPEYKACMEDCMARKSQ